MRYLSDCYYYYTVNKPMTAFIGKNKKQFVIMGTVVGIHMYTVSVKVFRTLPEIPLFIQ